MDDNDAQERPAGGNAPELNDLAAMGRRAMSSLAKHEGKALEHWSDLGRALREGRELHNDDKAFGKWKKTHIYAHVPNYPKPNANLEVAIMWLSANPAQVAEVRKRHRKLNSSRKLHDAWKRLVDETLKDADWAEEEQLTKAGAAIGASPADIEAARRRMLIRAERAGRRAASERQAAAELEKMIAAEVAARVERMLSELPEELRERLQQAGKRKAGTPRRRIDKEDPENSPT